MTAPNRHDATMAAARRQYQVGQLAWDNWTPDAIAAHLGCSVKRVRADLEAMDMIPDRGPYPQCGTGAGYSIHRRQHTLVCRACNDAANQQKRKRRTA